MNQFQLRNIISTVFSYLSTAYMLLWGIIGVLLIFLIEKGAELNYAVVSTVLIFLIGVRVEMVLHGIEEKS